MSQILVYGDSLSWGIVPGTRERLSFDARWPGVLASGLVERGRRERLVEDCVNGRRTVWDDPFKPGRKGIEGLATRIEAQSPLALVILMLGTNDFQSTHANNAWHSSQGLAALVHAIRTAPIEPGMPVPPILVIAPPPITTPRGTIAPKFAGGEVRCVGAAEAYAQMCRETGCHFFDAGQVVHASPTDGVHLDAAEHRTLGLALVEPVAELLEGRA